MPGWRGPVSRRRSLSKGSENLVKKQREASVDGIISSKIGVYWLKERGKNIYNPVASIYSFLSFHR